MLQKFLGRLKPDDWRLVHTQVVGITYDRVESKIFYYLSESRKGKRKMEYKSNYTFPHWDDVYARTNYYLDTIYPWMQGAYNKDILRYADIPQENLIKALKG